MIRSSESQQTQAFSNDYESVLPDHYRLIEMLGRGGMAEVFLAEDKRLGRKVAIKFLNSEFRRDPDRMRRFRQEAKSASALNHPNILTIHDIGENRGVQYLVSEFVEGETIGSRISRGRLPISEAVDITLQVASALSASHGAGIVHRDIKPDNLMIRRDGVVKVLDFGLAKTRGFVTSSGVDFDAMTLDSGSTSPGLIVGTPQYMSPEQARGKELDGRTDIFSLGSVLFEMVTQISPFAGESFADTMAAILTREPRRLEEYLENPPLRLIDILSNALKKDRDQRFSAMGEVIFELRQLQSELSANPTYSIQSRVAATDQTEIRPTDQHSIRQYVSDGLRKNSATGLILALAGVVILALFWVYIERNAAPSPSQVLRAVPITTWSSATGELASAASFSHDSKMIAYTANSSGTAEIWVKPTDVGDPIQVTKNGGWSQYPVWSPDSREIAFISGRSSSRGIWRVAFTGGQQTEIASGIGSSARLVEWGAKGRIYLQENAELLAIDEQSGMLTKVTNLSARGLLPRTIEISADETRIAYSIKESDTWKIYVEPLGSVERTEFATSDRQIDDLSWRPDGRSLVFSAQVDGRYQIFESAGPNTQVQISNGNTDLHVQDVSEDGLKVLYGSVTEASDVWRLDRSTKQYSLVANESAAEYWPDMSPDGSAITFQSVTQTERPYSGSIITKTSDGSFFTSAASGFQPTWSNDGTSIAYLRKDDTGIGLWRAGRTGENALKIADGEIATPGYVAIPYLWVGKAAAWSPDSSKVAFVKKKEQKWNLWLAAADGSGETMLTNNSDSKVVYSSPYWSADGKLVVIVSENLDPRSYRLSVCYTENSAERIVYESETSIRMLGVSSSGGEAIIAQRADAAKPGQIGPVDIRSVSLDSGLVTSRMTLENTFVNNIHLSHDGLTVAFVSRVDGESTLWTIPLKGGTAQREFKEKDPKVLISSLAWSRDGRFLAFGKQTRTQSISMLSK